MKRILAVAVLVAVTTSLALGEMADKQEKTKGGKAGVEQALMQLEREWMEAAQKKDAATPDKILADDGVGALPTGVATKAEVLADLKSGDNKLESITLGDMKVRLFGDTAVVTGSDDEKSSYKDTDTSGHYTWTDVFVKRQGLLARAGRPSPLPRGKGSSHKGMRLTLSSISRKARSGSPSCPRPAEKPRSPY
jgi:ketosteroid isomerase-like protein